jgi:hypothetical protein
MIVAACAPWSWASATHCSVTTAVAASVEPAVAVVLEELGRP